MDNVKKFEEFDKVNESDEKVDVIGKFLRVYAEEYGGKFDELINDFYVEFESFCEENEYECKNEDIAKALKDVTDI